MLRCLRANRTSRVPLWYAPSILLINYLMHDAGHVARFNPKASDKRKISQTKYVANTKGARAGDAMSGRSVHAGVL